MKRFFQLFLASIILMTVTSSLYAQEIEKNSKESTLKTDFSDRQAILKTIENFYIGDHTGSIEH